MSGQLEDFSTEMKIIKKPNGNSRTAKYNN